jgi:hypothetical protein
MTETAAKNGKTTARTAAKPAPAQREHGLARLREEECYYLTSLVKEGLGEAEHLVRKVNSKAFNRTVDYDGAKGTKPLDRAEARAVLAEAYECAALALAYLYEACTHLQDDTERDNPSAAVFAV